MKNKLQEIRKAINNKELTKEEVLLELFTDEDGDLYLSELDFSGFEGDVYIDYMKVNRDLRQNNQEVGGHLFQSLQTVGGDLIQANQKVGGDLYQRWHKVKGDLHQSYQEVEGDYYATSIKVKGKINFEEPTKMLKKITLQELKEMGYELEERE